MTRAAALVRQLLAFARRETLVAVGVHRARALAVTFDDTAAALRALEIRAEVLAKGTRVDGVFDRDPLKHPDAVLHRSISYTDVLARSLGVMDATAVAMCRDNALPVVVFNLGVPGNIMRVAMGETVGTLIHS